MSEFNLPFIASRRKELGLTLEDMAEAMGFSNSSVYWKYERGFYKFDASMLPALAKALKCRISRFYTQPLAKTES